MAKVDKPAIGRLGNLLVFLLVSFLTQSCATDNRRPSAPADPNQSFSDTNFPSAIILAAYGNAKKNLPNHPLNKKLGVDLTAQCQFTAGGSGGKDPNDNQFLELLLTVAKRQAMKEVADNDEIDEVSQALSLIKSGKFFRDVVDATIVSVRLVPEVKQIVGRGILRPTRLINNDSVRCPVNSLANSIRTRLKNPSLSQIVNDPVVLEAKLRCIYRVDTIRAVADTAATLLRNDSVKLAIIAYARSNGIDLDESDLDALRDTALATSEPNLDALVEHGKNRLVREFRSQDVAAVLNEMRNNQFDCAGG